MSPASQSDDSCGSAPSQTWSQVVFDSFFDKSLEGIRNDGQTGRILLGDGLPTDLLEVGGVQRRHLDVAGRHKTSFI